MIRLLEQDDNAGLRFRKFEDQSGGLPAYAILSHTWSEKSDDELSYDDVLSGTGKLKLGRKKVEFCMQQAAKDGLRYCWVDTCCIDKRHSQELSEAIISMFRWYKKSSKCYVLLSDVCADNSVFSIQSSSLRQARWFKRGWTLQELLAPTTVEFFNVDGIRLGDRDSMKEVISGITGISTLALRGTPLENFDEFERKSWIHGRQTKRPEDLAYCMLGILDVTIIPMYGEGRDSAQIRLEDEIQKKSSRRDLNDPDQKALAIDAHYDDEVSSTRPVKRPRYGTGSSISSERTRTILESLKFDQIEVRRLTIERAHGGTCEWLLKDARYLRWLEPKSQQDYNGFLWIKGKAGCGKSTIMKFIFDSTQRSMEDKIILSCFFNARGADLERSVAGAYRTLLVQLLENIPSLRSIFSILGPSLSRRESDAEWDVRLLKELFGEAIRNLGQRSVVCFVDALDECEEEDIRDLVRFFESLREEMGSHPNRIRVCFASRHYPYITIDKATELVLEGEEGHRQDIANYLTSELRIGHGDSAEAIRSELLEKASDVFIWVVLVVRMLNKEYDGGKMHALRRRLAEIPSDIHNLFHDILTRGSHNKSELALCIQWVLFAREPLTAMQLYLAVLSGGDDSLPVLSEVKQTASEDAERFVLNVSKGLVETTKSKISRVQFIHESVKDFLLKKKGLSRIWPELEANFEGRSHDKLKGSCQSYIKASHEGFLSLSKKNGRGLEAIDACFPLMRYSVTNILYHANEAEKAGMSQRNFFFGPAGFDKSNWIVAANVYEERVRRKYISTQTSLEYIFADRNMPNLIRSLATVESSLKREEERYGAPWTAALAARNADAALSFLDLHVMHQLSSRATDGRDEAVPQLQNLRNACVQDIRWYGAFRKNGKYSDGRSTMHHLLREGSYALRDLLIELAISGTAFGEEDNKVLLFHAIRVGNMRLLESQVKAVADIDSENETCKTPLMSAIEEECTQSIEILLQAGADVNCQRSATAALTPLAVSIGLLDAQERLKICEMLLQAGADPDQRYEGRRLGIYHTIRPLAHAARKNDEQTVELFLKYGADIKFPADEEYPLSSAAQHGNERIVTLLLEAGMEVNHLPDIQACPLSTSILQGNQSIFEMLLKAGANPNLSIEATSGDHKPIFHAIHHTREKMVEQLLNAGADVNLVVSRNTTRSQSLLSYAVLQGHERTVRLLLEAGANVDGLSTADCRPLFDAMMNLPVRQRTPLWTAAKKGNLEIVRILLQKGADVKGRASSQGVHHSHLDSPLNVARYFEHHAVVELLRAHGADTSYEFKDGDYDDSDPDIRPDIRRRRIATRPYHT